MLARGRRPVAILMCNLVQAIVLASDHFGKQKCLAGFSRHLLHSLSPSSSIPHCLAGTESKVHSSKVQKYFLMWCPRCKSTRLQRGYNDSAIVFQMAGLHEL